ncbi:hypothetical protein JCM24511_06071 [Saitozyma sp. JCM 24511]|nr:hypothetical protein JCM24511_06071 [Saitozyma sp. JCM 24511]
MMDENQNNQDNPNGHIDINPSTSPHNLTPEDFQQFQQILLGLSPVSSDLPEPTELAEGGGQHHPRSEFRGEGDQTQVHGQEAVVSSGNHGAALSLPLFGLSVPAPHNQQTFSAYPSTQHTLNTVPTVPLAQAPINTHFNNGIEFNHLTPGQDFGAGPTLPGSGPVLDPAPAPVSVSGSELHSAWQYDPTPVSQSRLNEDYILPPTWSHTTATATATDADADAAVPAAHPSHPYPIVPWSSAPFFPPVIPRSADPAVSAAPTRNSSVVPSQPHEHLYAGTISPELVRLSRPFVDQRTHLQQYQPQPQPKLPVPYHPSFSLPLPPLAAAQHTSAGPFVSGPSQPLPQTQPVSDVELIFPVLSTSVPCVAPDRHGITSTLSNLMCGGEGYSEMTVETDWRGWSGGHGGDGGDGGDGLSDVSESEDEDEDEDEDHRHTPAGCGVAVADLEFESEDGSEAYHDGDGGYDTEHDDNHKPSAADDDANANADADTDTDTDDADDSSESSFSATSHLSAPPLVPSASVSFPGPPRTPTQPAGITTPGNADPRHVSMRDMVSNATPSSSDSHIGTRSATRQAIGVGTLHVTLSTDSDGSSSPVAQQAVRGAVTITPTVEPVKYTSAEYPVPEEMWDGEEEMEMKVEVEEDVAGEANVADGDAALQESTEKAARGIPNEAEVGYSSNAVVAKQSRGTTRSNPRARSVPNVRVSEHEPEPNQSLQVQGDKERRSDAHPRSRPNSDEGRGGSSGSESDTGSDSNAELKDPTYQPRNGPTTRSSTRYRPQTLTSHERTNVFWTGPLRAVVHPAEDSNSNSSPSSNLLSKSTSKSTSNNPSAGSGPSSKSKSKSTGKSSKRASGRISNKALVTGSRTGTAGSTVPWSGFRTKVAGPGRIKKELSDEARANVESLQERLEATESRSHINFDEKVFRVLVDERFTEYIHWAELDNGEWGVVIPRENEFDTIVAPYLRNKAHAQRGAVRRQWSTYGFRTGQATTIQGVSAYHISHPLLKREDESLWELVRSLPQLRGASDAPTTKQPSKVARLSARTEQLQRKLRLALETNEALLMANAALEQRIRDICEQFPSIGE